jgi:hypothetical protein
MRHDQCGCKRWPAMSHPVGRRGRCAGCGRCRTAGIASRWGRRGREPRPRHAPAAAIRSGSGLRAIWGMASANRAVRPAWAGVASAALQALAKRRGMCDNMVTGWRVHVGKPPQPGGRAAAEMGQQRTFRLAWTARTAQLGEMC